MQTIVIIAIVYGVVTDRRTVNSMLSPELQEMYDKLSEKQKLFVDLWTGEQTETARMAGYSDFRKAGNLCMNNANICQLIRAKRDAEIEPYIASRKERQKFWTETMRDQDVNIRDRLKSSELLGKSEGDFIERYKDESGPRVIKVEPLD